LHTVHLVDASPYIFRAHFSLPSSIKSPAGERTGAVYGFASFLLKLITDEKPTHLGVAFDRNLNGSFRNDFYPAYKAQRDEPPPEIVAQIDPCLEVAAALGAVPWIDDRYEADDLIATVCDAVTRRGHRAVVVTSDKDLAQLVSEQVTLLDFAKETRFTPADVREKFGVRPDQIVDLLALAGDPVDNIPGVPGIGRKTAADLLAAFGSVEELYTRLEDLRVSQIRGARSLYTKLTEARESAFLSKRLATVAYDAPLAPPADELAADGLRALAYRGADAEEVGALFDRLGFKGIRERVPAQEPRK
jgi:5'-3' exonuclease